MTDSISADTLHEIARRVFGESAEVSCIREIAPSKSHGITETPPSTRNLLYVVELADHPQAYVFRFSRVDDDVYEQEARNYELLSESTGVRVPTIYSLDTSKRVVPTSYMVMDYLPGKLWQYVAHPENPNTDKRDKDAIAELVGRFYARVHEATAEMPGPGTETQTLLYTIDRLEEAVRRNNVDATPAEVDRCRHAIKAEPLFKARRLNLCLADTEIHVMKKDGKWDLAFVCDAEWIEYRHPYADLTQAIAGAEPWWRLDQPATDLDASVVSTLPFFRGYDPENHLDYADFLHHAVYYQLGLWAYVAMSSRSQAKKMWVRQAKGPLIRRLIEIVYERADPVTAVH